MKAELMRCVQCPSEADLPSWMRGSWPRYERSSCRVRQNMGLEPSCGHSSGWALSLSDSTACGSVRRMYGVYWAHWVSARKSPTSAPSSVMRTLCANGNDAPGRPLKKSPARAASDRFCGRVGHQRATPTCTYLGSQRADAHHPVPLQLESRLGHRRNDAHQLHVQTARGQHQERRNRRFPQSAQGSLETTPVGHLGWAQGAQKPPSERLSGYTQRTHPDCLSSSLCARSESSRILVGLAQAPCSGQLLPQPLGRTARHRTQQAQKRTKTTLDHRLLLATGYPLVMS